MNLSGKGNERLRVSIVLDGTPGPSLSTSISNRAGIRDRKVQELPGATYRAFHFAPSNESEATEVAFGFQEAIIRDLNVVQHGKGDRGPAVLFSRVFEPEHATPRDMVVARIRESARLQELSSLAAVASTANVLSIGPMPELDRTPHEQLGPAPLPGMEGMWKVLSAKSPALANIEIDCPDLPKPIENSLPSGLSLFIGRGSELRRLQKLLDSSRLVTLTGSEIGRASCRERV